MKGDTTGICNGKATGVYHMPRGHILSMEQTHASAPSSAAVMR